MTPDAVKEICQRLGYLGADGQLRQLDSLEQMEILVEAEQSLGVPIEIEAVKPDIFASLGTLTSFLAGQAAQA